MTHLQTAPGGLSPTQAALKRGFDVLGAALGLALTFWLIALAWLAATLDTRANGFFTQQRVGRDGRLFRVIKLRTMRVDPSLSTTVTTAGDARITRLGRVLRRLKLDELPQLINVLLGHMSFVGPRPDVPGFADALVGDDRLVLSVRPGITGPATLKYRDEETLLAGVDDPERYNREVIFPDKVRLNREYVQQWSFFKDLQYIWQTVMGTRGA
ncbi:MULTISPECIES: sugar transferase [unclassified Ectothiorhodospira]|uniref:sugar transferase n=1 Tax=unclassified Ectothiorhodospira TaxID=2684909 RepID=UPI001EE7D334|nr:MULTISPECIES: sugar transferase [unclassified Ectothiorhodospira]MCG5516397.1 sugar transferase [Ectothiorhodospira sp. 9100]MCG5519353.1 sugar transferase [Ectothiorhodospira sp. 9905]